MRYGVTTIDGNRNKKIDCKAYFLDKKHNGI